MASITTILSTDAPADSRTDINDNFSALNVEVVAATTAIASANTAITAKANSANGTHTGTTSVQVLSPDIADLGTAASGTVTLSSTKAVNKVILSGSAATIALPSSPPDGWRSLVVSVTGNVALVITTPSLYRIDTPSLGAVTSVAIAAASAGKVIFSFLAVGGSFVGMTVIGDDVEIPSDVLAGLVDDETNASPAASTFMSTRALALYLAAQLDGLNVSYANLLGLTSGKFIAGDENDEPILGSFGTGLSYNAATGTLTATAGGASSTVSVSGTNVNWADGLAQRDSISTNKAYTMSNVADGQTLRLTITATGADRTPTWPSYVSFGDAGAPTITAGESVLIAFTAVGNAVVAVTSPGHVIDVTPPETTAWQIQAAGDVLHITPSESITVTTPPAVTLSMSGGAVTATYDTGTSPMIYDLSRVVGPGETGTCSGTVTAGGVVDAGNNTLEDWTSEAVDNDSTATGYILAVDMNSGTAPASWTDVGGTAVWNHTPAIGGGTYSGEIAASGYFDLGADYTEVWAFLHLDITGLTSSPHIAFANSSGTVQATYEPRTDRIQRSHGSQAGGATMSMTGADAAGVHWFRYKAETVPGSSADGILEIYANWNSTSETRPAVKTQLTAGTGDAIRRIYIYSPAAGVTVIGKLRVSATAIGDSPV